MSAGTIAQSNVRSLQLGGRAYALAALRPFLVAMYPTQQRDDLHQELRRSRSVSTRAVQHPRRALEYSLGACLSSICLFDGTEEKESPLKFK